jgi:hypothetical protein
MNVVEKRDFIHSHLHQAEEKVINEFYEILRENDLLKLKLESRALKSEIDIDSGHVFSRDEVEKRIGNMNR